MTTSNEFDSRLAKANTALSSNAPELSSTVVSAATKTRSRPSLLDRFSLMSAQAKTFAYGGLASGATAIIAVTLLVNISSAPLIQLASSPGAESSRNAMATEGAADQMVSMPFNTFDYLAGPGLSNEPGIGQIYRLALNGTPESVLTAVANVFGVTGAVKQFPDFDPVNPGYFFGESDEPWGLDEQGPTVSIFWSGSGSWNYSNPTNTASTMNCKTESSEGSCEEYFEAQPTPELLPSRADAVSKALEVFNATGLSVSESDLRIDYSDWGVAVYAPMIVDGQPTSLEWYIGWDSNGELSYAGGHSVIAESAGTFETISEVQAVSRLADWRWFGSAATSYFEKFQPPIGDSSVRGSETIEPDFGTSEQPTKPEVSTLTVVTAERALVSIWDAAGNMWLVPGFVLVNDQGWFDAVVSVIEGIIALPEPSTLDIVPLPADDSSVTN